MTKQQETEMRYAGAIRVLAEAMVHLTDNADAREVREMADEAIDDWCALSGWERHDILNRVELVPPT